MRNYIYLLLFFSTCILFNCNSSQETEKIIAANKYEKSRKEFIRKYDFKVESLISKIQISKKESLKKIKSEAPIIIYRETKGKIEFDYLLNYLIRGEFHSYKLNDIKTIVFVKDTLIKVGHYSGKEKAKAFVKNTQITFIDVFGKRQTDFTVLLGEEPPEEFKTRSGIGDSIIGKPNDHWKIITTIKSQLK